MTTARRIITLYDAVEVLWEHRHELRGDVLRSLDSIWLCGSAARYGEPYEARDPESDAAFCRDHAAACEQESTAIPAGTGGGGAV